VYFQGEFGYLVKKHSQIYYRHLCTLLQKIRENAQEKALHICEEPFLLPVVYEEIFMRDFKMK